MATPTDLDVCIRQMKQRIAELEETIRRVEAVVRFRSDGCAHDVLEVLRTAEFVASQGEDNKQRICHICNQEMGNPHHCRPNWYGPTLGGKVVDDE